MKKVRICMEIQGLCQDETGAPCPGGVCITLGEDGAEEISEEEYRQFIGKISVQDVLCVSWLDAHYKPEDCRLITPEEYDREYGEKADA